MLHRLSEISYTSRVFSVKKIYSKNIKTSLLVIGDENTRKIILHEFYFSV